MDGMVGPVAIGPRLIGPGHPCFLIAEAGVNHNGDITVAQRLVEVSAKAGADAVKFQSFHADRLVTAMAPTARYQREAAGGEESQLAMLRRLELSAEDQRKLQASCQAHGVLFLSTPFDESSADELQAMAVPAFKISSGDLTNLPFLAYIARMRRPMLISTGMATLEEVGKAVRTVEEAGNREIVLLHCVSCYPTDPGDVNLRAMQTMREAFPYPVGFSDHTKGFEIALAAAALGAAVIEKHVTLDRSLPGPDHRASLEPQDWAQLVAGVRTVERALGHGRKVPVKAEAEIAAVARKSVVAATDIEAGSALTEEMLAIRRPGTGLPPDKRQALIGRRVIVRIKAGTPMTWDLLA
jgi:N-acetylneuraminate synthase